LAAASGAVPASSKQVESLEKKVADKPALFAESAAFKRVDLLERVADEKEKDKFAPAPPVLISFQVRQAGDRVQFIDHDGSVYEGQILPEFALASRARTVSRPAAAAPEPRSGLSQKAASPPTVAQSVPQGGAASAYRFTVTGTNATSGQKVVFTGSLSGVTDLAGFLAGPTAGPTQRDSQALRFQATSGASSLGTAGQQVVAPRISGKVVVGQGQQIDVEAVYSAAPR
jgi:hypothetical protein